MKKTHSLPHLFEDKPLFGLDIGRETVRVMQLDPTKQQPQVIGYGEIGFDPSYSKDGTIIELEKLAGSVKKLFDHSLVGDITTRRVAVSVPISRAFTRSLVLPKLTEKEYREAVKTEVEQYIPAIPESLYIDYSTVETDKDTWTTFIVAMPRRIIDSYLTLTRLLGLETIIIQTSSGADASLFARDKKSYLPSLLIDFGSNSADITVFDHGPIVTVTVACGGEQITDLIMKSLDVNHREATIIKSKHGLSYGKKQKQITTALQLPLGTLIREIQRTARYYNELSKGKQTINQIAVMGGGANMPGLADYLTDRLRIPVRAFDPTSFLDFGHLQPLGINGRMSYVNAAGLAIMNPGEAF